MTNIVNPLPVDDDSRSAEMLKLLYLAVMQSANPILITDAVIDLPGPRIVFVNAAFTRLTGYEAPEVIGRTPRILQGPATERAVLDRLRRCLERGQDFEGSAFQYRKDGSMYLQEWRVTPVRDADGQVTHFISIQRDVTERQREADQLQASERAQRGLAAALERERSRLLAAQRVARVGSWETDPRTLDVMWSEETHRIHETDPATFRPTHASFLQLVHPDDRTAVNQAFERSLARRDANVLQHRLLFPDGRVKTVEERWQTAFDDDGIPLVVIGTCQDISEHTRVQSALRESVLKYERLNRVHVLLSQINALIVRVADRDELFRETCRIAVENGGFRMAMICFEESERGRVMPATFAGTNDRIMSAVRKVLASEEVAPDSLVYKVLRDRRTCVVNDISHDAGVLLIDLYRAEGVRSLAILPIVAEDRVVGVFALYAAEPHYFDEEQLKLLANLAGDISFACDHIQKQERLDYLAYYDTLTGLANRSLFIERIRQYVRSGPRDGEKLLIALFDLERFKNINDALGRAAGDALLRQVAQWLSDHAQDPNLLARLGADHFAFVLPQLLPGGNVRSLFEKMMARFEAQVFEVDGQRLRIAGKAGVAIYPDHGEDIDTLFRNAETALKASKAKGERVMFFDRAMSERVANDMMLENELRQALGNDEFELHYQPKVSLASGEVVGAEALIRWNNPGRGLLMPNQFVPILEETGLINSVGRWVIRQAVSDYLKWRDANLGAVRLAVNVSALQLRNRNFVSDLQALLSVDDRAAEGLELEFTESMVMENVEHGIEALSAIRALGVHCALDDFGTGYSSLSYLSRLPLDSVKIDRSFVVALSEGPGGTSMVSNIITLAHALTLKVVAEGVETSGQSHLLQQLRCDEIQGFLISRAVPADRFEQQFLIAGRPLLGLERLE